MKKIKSYTGIWNVEKSYMQSMTLTCPFPLLYTDYMVCDYGIYHHSVWGYAPLSMIEEHFSNTSVFPLLSLGLCRRKPLTERSRTAF